VWRLLAILGWVVGGCVTVTVPPQPRASPAATALVSIDRFAPGVGHLQLRDGMRALPGPDEPIDFDVEPFITSGLGPDGAKVRYYNFDVQPRRPALVYRFVWAGSRRPLAHQPDVIDAIPGDPGYSDFARVAWVEVPHGETRLVTSAAEIVARRLRVTFDRAVEDCPVVPRGSRARENPGGLTEELYRGERVVCLRFTDFRLEIGDDGLVPTSPIYVAFSVNPGEPSGGPASGFHTEPGTAQTHNVVLSVPGDLDYSPLWDVNIYDTMAFAHVANADDAGRAPALGRGGFVNCPIVFVAQR